MSSASPRPVPEHVAIIGAGVMGRSIALANLRRGIPVTLTDTSPAVLRSAADSIDRQLGSDAVSRAQLRTVAALGDLPHTPVVIEAIVENQSAKRRLLGALERRISTEALLATNTSSLSVAALAETLQHPHRFCGLHFCHPVADRPLVEVIAGPHTAPATLDRALGYVASLGKRPLRTADVTGFAVNRLLFPYLESAVELVRAGVDWEAIESAGINFGMPMGPLSQIDDIGIDVILRAAAALHRGDDQVPANSEPLLALYQAGRLGRKTGAGFFAYQDHTGVRSADPRAVEIVGVASPNSSSLSPADITKHLFVPMLAAAAELVDCQIVSSVDDIRTALRDGLGFDPPRHDLLDWGAGFDFHELSGWLDRLSRACWRDAVGRLLAAGAMSRGV